MIQVKKESECSKVRGGWNKDEIEKLKKFSDSMLHSAKQTGKYVRKD